MKSYFKSLRGTAATDFKVSGSSTEKEKLQSWNKSYEIFAFKSLNEDKDDFKKRWKNENALNTINHTTAYENSIEASNLFDNENIKNPFEFPRQQNENQRNKPEVMQFKTSQRLFGSQPPTSSQQIGNNDEQYVLPQMAPSADTAVVLMEGFESDLVFPVRENFPGFFEKKDEVYPFEFEFNGKDSVEDGFPDVLDLSNFYITKADGSEMLKADEGKSIFATAFKNRDFKDEEMDAHEIIENDIEAENMRKIKNMTSEAIAAAREEILERFDPSVIEFLKNRMAKTAKSESSAAAGDSINKVSKFRLKRMAGESETPKKEEDSNEVAVEEVKNLEFFNLDDPSGSDVNAKFSRLAMNAVQMDLASKSYGLTAPRQQTAWITIFDKLAASTSTTENDELINMALQNISKIKELYIEEVLVSENKTKLEFAADVKPASDGSWMFVPIRRVLDAVEDKRLPSADDAEIIRLTLLFSVLFWKRQSTLMHMFGSPSDALCCVAETFMLGPEIYHDNIIDRAITVLLDEYFIPYGQKGKLAFAATKPIARLDAFLPFYYDLMKKYEQYGGGCSNFSRILFTMACMNSVPQDAILLLVNVWDPGCAIVRQCDISSSHMQPLLHHLILVRKINNFYVESELFLQYGRLLTLYAVAIRDEKVIRERNPGLFNLAATEIGEFIKFWSLFKVQNIARHEEVEFLSQKLVEATSPFINF